MGDERATQWSAEVEAVYRAHSRELWSLFYAHCSDADRAFEAVQEVFARLQEQNGTVIRDPRAWLLQVGRNWLRDVARRRKVAARPSEHLDNLPGNTDTAGTDLIRDELHGQVRAALAELKLEDRQVLILRYALNWSSQRIAEALETTAPAVDMRLSRARRRLAGVLKQHGIEGQPED